MNILRGIEVQTKRHEVLHLLHKNLEAHTAIVAEAREGYLEHARTVLTVRLKQIEDGKLVDLNFSLRLPRDHSKVYETAIRMLELEQRDLVMLDSTQVRNLCMDEWDWSEEFFTSNSAFSGAAQRVSAQRAQKRTFGVT